MHFLSVSARAVIRTARATTAFVLAAGLFGTAAHAAYPERPVRVVIGLQAGASTDTLGRALAQKLSERLGQQFLIDNRPGAATRIAMEAVSRAPADGYTLGIVNAVAVNFPLMFKDFDFSPGKDFAPITTLGRAPSFLAVPATLPAKNVEEFLAYAKANNGKLTFGQGSNGSNPHLSALMLVKSMGVDAVGIPYKGNAPTALAVATGEVDFAMLDYQSVRPLVERGNVRLLAVTEPQRFVMMPDVPTGGEQGLSSALDGVTPWFMLVAPPGTPDDVIALLNRHVNDVLKDATVREAMSTVGIETDGSSIQEAAAYFQQQREQTAQVAKEMNVSFQ